MFLTEHSDCISVDEYALAAPKQVMYLLGAILPRYNSLIWIGQMEVPMSKFGLSARRALTEMILVSRNSKLGEEQCLVISEKDLYLGKMAAGWYTKLLPEVVWDRKATWVSSHQCSETSL